MDVRPRDRLVSDRIPWTGSIVVGAFFKSAGNGSILVADSTRVMSTAPVVPACEIKAWVPALRTHSSVPSFSESQTVVSRQ